MQIRELEAKIAEILGNDVVNSVHYNAPDAFLLIRVDCDRFEYTMLDKLLPVLKEFEDEQQAGIDLRITRS